MCRPWRRPGVPDCEVDIAAGMVVRWTPDDIAQRLHGEIVKALAQPEIVERLSALGFEPVASTRDQFAAWINAEISGAGAGSFMASTFRSGMISQTATREPGMKAIALGLAVALVAGASLAQPSDYPNRPVKVIAPFAPGGPVDIVARVLAPKLSERLGQQFYVRNHPGGSGNIGTAMAAKAPADGYTILVISSTLVVNPSLFNKLGFDTTSDLSPVSLVGVSPQVLLVNPNVPATNVKELVAWVKASPGKHSYAHAGLGTPGYLAGEMLKQAFGLDLVAVSFNGGGPAITSTIGGHTPFSTPRSQPPPNTSSGAPCARSP